MKVHFATDHAGFELKNTLLTFVRDELGLEVIDHGAYEFNGEDDYPAFIHAAAMAVSEGKSSEDKAIILGASGQGEAMVANRYKGVRAAVYYGAPRHMQIDAGGTELDMVASVRAHNDANVLSLGGRFISADEAKDVVKIFLTTAFSGEERHQRRIAQIEEGTRSV